MAPGLTIYFHVESSIRTHSTEPSTRFCAVSLFMLHIIRSCGRSWKLMSPLGSGSAQRIFWLSCVFVHVKSGQGVWYFLYKIVLSRIRRLCLQKGFFFPLRRVIMEPSVFPWWTTRQQVTELPVSTTTAWLTRYRVAKSYAVSTGVRLGLFHPYRL